MSGIGASVTVRVRYFVLFWLWTGRKRTESVALPAGAVLAELFGVLGARHGRDLGDRLTREGRLHPLCWCLVNGRKLAGTELDLVLRDGDDVVLTTPLLVGG